mmetsp:Transcript_22025/g.30728  ORF Transcript_22025/g.30728 Transcript_22025/m.30728 type:complete len:118 (-) Transcript_22025:73-426(-)
MGGGMGATGGSYDMKAYSNGPSRPINTLYVTGLSHSTLESQLNEILSKHEGFMALNFVQKFGRSPHAFVLFGDPQSSTNALNQLNGQMLNGRPMIVQYAKSEMHKGVATSGPVLNQR